MYITPSGWVSTLAYLAGMAATIFALCYLLKRFRLNPFLYIVACFVYLAASIGLAKLISIGGFDFVRLLAFGWFLGGTALLVAMSWIAWSCKFRVFGGFLGLISLVSAGVSVDATIIEPRSLETRFEKVTSEKITKPVRIALVADIQTDDFGDYERDALAKVLQQKPDIILMAGDYLQCFTKADYEREIKDFHKALTDLGWSAPLGVYIVKGDVESAGYDASRKQSVDGSEYADSWPKIFEGLPVTLISEVKTIELDEIAITGLTLYQSRSTTSVAPKIDNKFHVVLGHSPNFMLGTTADLLVAGHTHGGQVQVPNYGPLITYSSVPREWGAGCHVVAKDGSHAIISRGVGMERLDAPRLRFFCHPEIVICDLIPTNRVSSESWRGSSAK